LRKRWTARREAGVPMALGHFFAGLGWFLAVPAASSLAHVLGGGDRSASWTIVYAFVAAAILTVVEFTSALGTAQAFAWMENWSVLQEPSTTEPGELTAAQAFEMMYVLTHSRELWMYAADDLLLAMATATASALSYSSNQISHWHAHLGIAVAALSVFDFIFEVSRLVAWRWANNCAIVTTLIIDAVLLPIWLLWLALLLRKISMQGGVYAPALETIPEVSDADLAPRGGPSPMGGGNRVEPTATRTGPVEVEMVQSEMAPPTPKPYSPRDESIELADAA